MAKNKVKSEIKEDIALNDYFQTEISYLTTFNCSYGLNTILDFLNKTTIDIKVLNYIDNCNKIEEKFNYPKLITKSFLINNSDPYQYVVCYDSFCEKVPKIGKHFCIVYSLKGIIYFRCF